MGYRLIENEEQVPQHYWQRGYDGVRGLAEVRKTGKKIVIAHGDTLAIRLMTWVVTGIVIYATYTFWAHGEYVWAVGCELLTLVMLASCVHPFRWATESDRAMADISITMFVAALVALITYPYWIGYMGTK